MEAIKKYIDNFFLNKKMNNRYDTMRGQTEYENNTTNRESLESRAADCKEQILNLLDKVDNDDLKFLVQIATMMKTHITIRSERKKTHHEK